ncbi:MAG: DUF1428 domain-containing protein [Bdellovibrionales bacterium]
MPYVDGFVLNVPKKNLPAYKKMAAKASKIWREYGAVDYKECVLDDGRAKGCLAFPKLAKSKTGETIVFSYIVYKSRAHRDATLKKVMKDKRLNDMCKDGKMPFDPKRMAYGGFKVMVSA